MDKSNNAVWKKSFLISPVAFSNPDIERRIDDYIGECADHKISMYYPRKHTEQDSDPIGRRIVTDNRNAILGSDDVHIFYSPTSTGSVFDLGMAFMAGKNLVVANPLALFTGETPDSVIVSKFIVAYGGLDGSQTRMKSGLYEFAENKRFELSRTNVLNFTWRGKNPYDLVEFGMAFMAMHLQCLKFNVLNISDIEPKPDKSFENILIQLTAEYKRNQSV